MFSNYFYRNFKKEMEKIMIDDGGEPGTDITWNAAIVKTFESLYGFETRLNKEFSKDDSDIHYLVISKGVYISCCNEEQKFLLDVGNRFIFKEIDINCCPICKVQEIKDKLGVSRTIDLKNGKTRQRNAMSARGFPEISEDKES